MGDETLAALGRRTGEMFVGARLAVLKGVVSGRVTLGQRRDFLSLLRDNPTTEGGLSFQEALSSEILAKAQETGAPWALALRGTDGARLVEDARPVEAIGDGSILQWIMDHWEEILQLILQLIAIFAAV